VRILYICFTKYEASEILHRLCPKDIKLRFEWVGGDLLDEAVGMTGLTVSRHEKFLRSSFTFLRILLFNLQLPYKLSSGSFAFVAAVTEGKSPKLLFPSVPLLSTSQRRLSLFNTVFPYAPDI